MKIGDIYCVLDGTKFVNDYHKRHNIKSALILRNYSQNKAKECIKEIEREIKNKIVVEIGAGVGCLALEMAKHAKKVIAIEADPAWSWYFTEYLYKEKPKNLTWIFGAAGEICEYISADVAVICTCSGLKDMKAIGSKMAKKVLTV